MKADRGKGKIFADRRLAAVLSVWIAFLALSLIYYIRSMVPSHIFYHANNPYTMDSVWDGEGNDWHNDVLLHTLFSRCKVYIHPDSWYFDYVSAFAEDLAADDRIGVMVELEPAWEDSWLCLNHMIAVQNETLFDRDVIDAIAAKAPDGAALLYVHEESIGAWREGIVVQQDEAGNLYLRGYDSEEYR
nr:hypothetical protein [uncultured Acetatifactor sp.]